MKCKIFAAESDMLLRATQDAEDKMNAFFESHYVAVYSIHASTACSMASAQGEGYKETFVHTITMIYSEVNP